MMGNAFKEIYAGLDEAISHAKGEKTKIIEYRGTASGTKMRESIKFAIGETVQGTLDLGLKTSFTEKELKSLGVKIQNVKIDMYKNS